VPRTQHIALPVPKTDKIFVFGGHSSPQARLNDTWFLSTTNFGWKRAENEEAATVHNQESLTGAPPPRANTAVTIVDNKIYIYGGHGGLNYSRIAFNDMYSFDLETHVWEKIEA
jgi:dynein heavy chain